jgi:hypothetical protein
MSWKSPTGYYDESNVWNNEPYAYDGNVSTYANSTVLAHSWSGFLDLLIDPPILCDKVQLYASQFHANIDQVQIDVYYNSDWHTIFNGSFSLNVWQTYTIPDGPQVVSKARVRFYEDSTASGSAYLCEFNFNQSAVRPLVGGSLVDDTLIGKGLM